MTDKFFNPDDVHCDDRVILISGSKKGRTGRIIKANSQSSTILVKLDNGGAYDFYRRRFRRIGELSAHDFLFVFGYDFPGCLTLEC